MIGIAVYFIGVFLLAGILLFRRRISNHRLLFLVSVAGIVCLVEGVLVIYLTNDPFPQLPEIPMTWLVSIFSLPPLSMVSYFVIDIWRTTKNVAKDFGYVKDLCPIFDKNIREKLKRIVLKSHK